MLDDTLSLLPPIQKVKSGRRGMSFERAAKAPPPVKKPSISIVEAKKVAKLLEGKGKTVTGITVTPNGGFTMTAADPATIPAHEPNEWDSVLP